MRKGSTLGARTPWPVLALATFLACSSLRQVVGKEDPPEYKQPRAICKFRSSTEALEPNQRFHLAVELSMSDEWWVPWGAPGFWSTAPRLSVEAPEGFEVSEPLFPGPERVGLNQGSTHFGYRGGAAWFVEVVAPKELDPARNYRFDIETSWRTCGDRDCQLQDAEGTVWIGSTEDPLDPAFDQELEARLLAVPGPIEEVLGGTQSWQSSPEGPVLVLRSPEGRWMDYLPLEDADKPARVQRRGNLLRATYSQAAPEARAIAAVSLSGQLRYVSIRSSP